MKKKKEKMAPSKKMVKPSKRVSQRKYTQADEKYDKREDFIDNKKKKPAGIATAMNKAKEGYSKKPRVKASKK